MQLSVFAIYFVVVSTGYPNPLDTTKEDNVEDRGNHYKRSCFCFSAKEINFWFIWKNWKILWPKFHLVWCKGPVGLGETCNSARRAIAPACCPTGAACKWESQPDGPDVGICRQMTKKGKIKQNMPFIIAWNNTVLLTRNQFWGEI